MTATRQAARKSSAARREDLVAAAFWLLGKGGASAVSTPALARRVGLTQSAVFKHFRNKEALWREVMDVLEVEVGSRLRAPGRRGGSATDRMLGIIESYLTVMLELPAVPALMFAELGQLDGAGQYLRREISQRLGWFQQSLAEQIRAGMQTGEFPSDAEPEIAGSLAAAIPQSLILRWRVSGGTIDMLAEAPKLFSQFLKSMK